MEPVPADWTCDAAAAARLRAFLLATGYTAEGVLERVGPAAFDALSRGLTVPMRRALAAAPNAQVERGEGRVPWSGVTRVPDRGRVGHGC
jgi:hypothetical protein